LAIDENWKRWLKKTIYFAYKNAHFFEESFPLIEQILTYECSTLHEFNSNSIIQICNHLNIRTVISTNHIAYLEMEHELELKYDRQIDEYYDNIPERKIRRIINICNNEHAQTYHNAINGMTLYKRDDFIPYLIDIKFIKTGPIEYRQFNDSFIRNLSIIDVLMHRGKAETRVLLNRYEII